MNSHPVLGAQIIAPVTQARAGAADHPPPPRVVQRLGLPRPPDRRRDPEARPDPPRRRRLRGDDGRPPVSHDAADRRAGARRAAQVRRHPVRSGGGRRVREDAPRRGRRRPGPDGPAAADPAHRSGGRPDGGRARATATPPANGSDRRPPSADRLARPHDLASRPETHARRRTHDAGVHDAMTADADRRHPARAASSACSPAAGCATSPTSGFAGSGLLVRRGRRPLRRPRSCSTPASRRRDAPAAAARDRLRPAARGALGEPRRTRA